MQVSRQAFRRDRKFDPWVAAQGVHGGGGAHQGLDERPKGVAAPAPDAIRESLLGRRLAHQLESSQPVGQWISFGAANSGREIGVGVLANVKGRKDLGDQSVEVGDDLGICVGEAGGCAREPTLRDEIAEKTRLADRLRCVLAETLDPSRNGDARAGRDVVERPPTLDGQERMVARDFDRATGPSYDAETWLDAAVDPGVDVLWLGPSIPRKPENGRHSATYGLLDRQPLGS